MKQRFDSDRYFFKIDVSLKTCLFLHIFLVDSGYSEKIDIRIPQEPGKDPSEASKVLLSATSEMDLWKGEVESGQGENRGGMTQVDERWENPKKSGPPKTTVLYIVRVK